MSDRNASTFCERCRSASPLNGYGPLLLAVSKPEV